MKAISLLLLSAMLCSGQSAPPENAWTKSLKNKSERGTLRDRYQFIRGDTGKWNDAPRLQHAPPIERKPARMLLDAWADQLLKQKVEVSSRDDNWLLFQSRQLDDNDRMWVERIERRDNRFTIVVSEAIWKGRYRKNFTWHNLIGVNLGKLKPGKYEVTWRIQPLEYEQFDKRATPPTRRNNWPKDDRPAKSKPTELSLTFTVSPAGN